MFTVLVHFHLFHPNLHISISACVSVCISLCVTPGPVLPLPLHTRQKMSCSSFAHWHMGHLLVGMVTSEPLGWAKGTSVRQTEGMSGLPLATGFRAGLASVHILDKQGWFSHCDWEIICSIVTGLNLSIIFLSIYLCISCIVTNIVSP